MGIRHVNTIRGGQIGISSELVIGAGISAQSRTKELWLKMADDSQDLRRAMILLSQADREKLIKMLQDADEDADE